MTADGGHLNWAVNTCCSSAYTEIASGEIASPKHEFGKLAVEALANYKTMYVDRKQRSQVTYDGIEGILNSRVKDYFNKVAVQNIDNTAWHKYKEDMVALYPNIKRGTLHQGLGLHLLNIQNFIVRLILMQKILNQEISYSTNMHSNSMTM